MIFSELLKPIPNVAVPSIGNFDLKKSDEELVSLSEMGFYAEPWYFSVSKIKWSLNDCYLRKTAAEMLLKAQSFLPKGLKFKVWDGYRPIEVQQELWDSQYNAVKKRYPDLSEKDMELKVSFFVSKPSYDENKPSLHNTGGAVDLTLVTDDGLELNMGTLFDDFTDRAWSNHFENFELNESVKINRRILYNAMINAGFTNLPSEWWHYDFGDKFWGYLIIKAPFMVA